MKERGIIKKIIGCNIGLIIIYIAFALVVQLLNIFNMEYMRHLLDDVIESNCILLKNIFIILGLVLIIIGINYVNCFLNSFLEKKMLFNIQNFLYKKNLCVKDFENYEFPKTKRFAVAEEDSKKVIEEVISNINIIIDFISVPIYIAYACIVNVYICILTIVVSLILSFINIKYSKKLNESNEAYYNAWDKWSIFLYKSLEMKKIIHMFLSQKKINNKIEYDNKEVNKFEVENMKSFLDMVKIKESFEIFYSTFIISFSFLLLFFNILKMSDLIVIMQLTSLLQSKLFDIPVNVSKLLKLNSCLSNINEIMNQKELTDDTRINFPIKKIIVKGLQVLYGDRTVLNDFNYTFTAGNFYWLIGDSGCGKSTILKSICNLNNHEGTICFDDSLTDNKKRDVLYKDISLVLQDINFFNGSLRENIICNDEYDENSYKKIISNLKIDEVLNKNNLTEEVQIGVDGAPFSSGEKQLIALARSLYSKKNIIILDEANSAMDLKNQENIVKVLHDYLDSNKIIIFISHILKNIKENDIVINLNDFQR